MVVLLTKARVDVAFHCLASRGALFIDGKLGKPLCSNTRVWFATGRYVEDDRILVEKGGVCQECGDMGQAALQDANASTHDGRVVTVEVLG